MTHWQCEKCSYIFETDVSLDQCHSCNEACTFHDVTCYTPDCGGQGNIDPQPASGKKGNTGKNNMTWSTEIEGNRGEQ